MSIHEVAFPEIKSFGDVFPSWAHEKGTIAPLSWRAEDHYFPRRKGSAMRTRTVTVEVGPYCSIHDLDGYRSIYVTPAPKIADYVRGRSAVPEGGSWQVTVRDDGTALITMQYSQIIGSIWIALVDARTLPPAPPRPVDPPPVYERNGTHTRAAYMDHKVDHHTYYAQFVTPSVREIVADHIGKGRIVASTDPHMNDIPLAMWDRLAGLARTAVNSAKFKDAGETWSLGTAVCVLKTAARILKREWSTKEGQP